MKALTPEELQDFAERYGVALDLAQRDYVACRVAHAIASDTAVANAMAFKGGFVLRIGHASPRTSKDIDGTLGTRKQNLEPARLQRLVRNGCQDLAITFRPKVADMGVDSLDFGIVGYSGPAGPGVLSLELSLREDWILDRERLDIDVYGIPRFSIWALALPEMVAEKWRCLVQRSPRRPGDPYDIWFLWTIVRGRHPERLASEVIRRLVPRKVTLGKNEGDGIYRAALEAYRRGWEGARGDAIPADAPRFDEIADAVDAAAREWTPWL